MELTMSVLYGLWWGFLRRWFGGLFPDEQYKILGNRGLQTTVMILSLLPVMFVRTKEIYSTLNIYIILAITLFITLWIQFQFWSRGHGATFLDMGRTKNPDLSRYDRWFKKPLDKCWNKLLQLKQNNKIAAFLLQKWSGRMYGYTYDMIYHTLRYTLCMIIPAILLKSLVFIIIGLISAPLYELAIRFYEKANYKYAWMKLPWLNSPNKPTEIIYGFIFGLLVY